MLAWNSWRLFAYSCALLIVLLAIPVGLVKLEAIPLSLVVAVFALLAVTAIWAADRSSVGSPAQEVFVTSGATLAMGARRTGLYDDVLGLYQAWYLELRLVEEMARCLRYDLSLALIVVKLDNNLASNLASNGWQGDASQAAYSTAKSIRAVDLAAALGPSEFAVCLIHCDEEGAETARSRLTNALKIHRPSSGVVVYPRETTSAKELIKLARRRAQTDRVRAA